LQVYTDNGEDTEITALTGASFPFAVVADDFKVTFYSLFQLNRFLEEAV
jgi:hypothetical protein